MEKEIRDLMEAAFIDFYQDVKGDYEEVNPEDQARLDKMYEDLIPKIVNVVNANS